MAKFVLAYHGGTAPDPDDAAAGDVIMAAWMAWFGELGDATEVVQQAVAAGSEQQELSPTPHFSRARQFVCFVVILRSR